METSNTTVDLEKTTNHFLKSIPRLADDEPREVERSFLKYLKGLLTLFVLLYTQHDFKVLKAIFFFFKKKNFEMYEPWEILQNDGWFFYE